MAVAAVLAAVAVNNVVVLATVVGVPANVLPVRLSPAGSVLAVYVIALPAPLLALSATLLMASF